MKQPARRENRNPNKIGKRKFKIEKLYIEETDVEIENFHLEKEIKDIKDEN